MPAPQSASVTLLLECLGKLALEGQPASYSAKLRSRLFLCYLTLSGDLDSVGTEEAAVNPEMRESYQHAAARLLHDEVIAQGLNATHEQCYQVILNLSDKETVLYGEGGTVDRLASVAAVLATRLLDEKEVGNAVGEGVRSVTPPTANGEKENT
jgi:hypothetical protein